ncbi:MAG: DUF1902 domain-containing protein [Devosia sp.]
MHHDEKPIVCAKWDDEAKVWVATSEDVPGLVTEDASLDNLVKRISVVIPELLEGNARRFEYHNDAGRFDIRIVSAIQRDGAADGP